MAADVNVGPVPAPVQTPMLTGPSLDAPVDTVTGDRGLPTMPWIAFFTQLGARALGGAFDEVIFNLAAGTTDLTTGLDKAPPRVITCQSPEMVFAEWVIRCGLASTGASLDVTIRKNGASFIALTVPAGSTSTVVVLFTGSLAYHDVFTIDVTGVGTGCQRVFIAGKYIYRGAP